MTDTDNKIITIIDGVTGQDDVTEIYIRVSDNAIVEVTEIKNEPTDTESSIERLVTGQEDKKEGE